MNNTDILVNILYLPGRWVFPPFYGSFCSKHVANLLLCVIPWVQLYFILSVPKYLKLSTCVKLVIQAYSFSYPKPAIWVGFLKIFLSNDIETNPGDFTNSFFTFCNWNINSIAKDNFQRVQLLEAHNSIHNYDLISLCETSLNDSIVLPDTLLEGYTFLTRNNPNNTRHGGVGLFYKNSLPLTVRDDLSFNEAIVVELKFGRKKIFFTVLYRSPSNGNGSLEFETFLQNFENLCIKIKSENPFSMFFCGDFNGHSQLWWPAGNSTPEGTQIEELTSFLGLTQMITEPTNFEPNKNPSCIDLIFTDQPNLVLDSGTSSSLDKHCHHQITYCHFNYKIPPPPAYERKIWAYDRANITLIRRSIAEFPWTEHFSQNPNVNYQVKSFTEILLNIMSNFIPNKIIKVRPRDPPWIDLNLKRMVRRQQRLYKNFKRHGCKPEDKVRVDAFRDECKLAIQAAKNNYLENLGNKLVDPNTCQKSYWKVINKVLNKCKAPKVPPILHNNTFLIKAKEKAHEFVKHFSLQCKPLQNNSTLPNFEYFTDNRLFHIPFSDDDILSIIRGLNTNKACGPDEITSKMINLCDVTIVLPLRLIFTNILSTGVYPDIWKEANVTPIHKKGSKQLVSNYRPISLLPICGKIFERIVFKYMYNFLSSNDLITKNQSGFRPGDSTINQLIDLTNDIHESFDNRKSLEVRAVFLDISKAFDKVWHKGLLFKLEQNGISGNVLSFFRSYLSNRKQRVVLNGSSSNLHTIESGVPQGSVLGPLLFLIYINDLEADLKSKVKFFADDTMLFSIVHDPNITAEELNHDLSVISTWAHQWKMSFNPELTKQAIEVLFSQKKKIVYHPSLFFNGSVVLKKESHKHLGLLLDSGLTFTDHLNNKIKMADKKIGVLRFLSKYLPLKTLSQMYKMFVRPHLDYGDIIYHIPHLVNEYDSTISLHPLMERVEKVQYHAALAITGCWRGSNRNTLYEELGWESLSDRRWSRRLIKYYKIHNNLSPEYLRVSLPPLRVPTVRRNNPHLYQDYMCNTSRYKNSFFPDAVRSWNNTGVDFVNSNSISIFKKNIVSLIRPYPKLIFDIHDPIGVKFLYQLRVGLSPLKYHKKRHNFIDTPDDWCDCHCAPEDVTHFLLYCDSHTNPRIYMRRTILTILTRYNLQHLLENIDLYLYGHRLLSTVDNKAVISATIRFVKETNRFS